MKYLMIISIFVAASLNLTTAQSTADKLVWTDSTKDVSINGIVDRNSQVLSSEATGRIALLSPKLEYAVMLDPSTNTVSVGSKRYFNFNADRASAWSEPDPAARVIGRYTQPDESTYTFSVDTYNVTISQHQGLIGETDTAHIFEIVPVWRSLMEAYQPDMPSVAAISTCGVDTDVTVALATWCSDSKQHIPRLLKTLEFAGNSRIHVRLVGVGRKLREPADFVNQYKIVKVPTIIVERKGVEVGRIVENPTSKTIEEDLAALLDAPPVTGHR